MSRVGVLGVWHETNTYSARPTAIEDFRSHELLRGDDIVRRHAGTGSVVGGMLTAGDLDLVPVTTAGAWPAGCVTRDALATIFDELETELARARADALLVNLHGAMVGEDADDVELETLRLVRRVAGDVPVVAVLDLHGNPSQEMVALCDAVIAYDTYPHVDMRERGEEATGLLRGILGGRKLRALVAKTPLLSTPLAQATDQSPMRDLRAQADASTHDGVVRVALLPGFPYSDVERAGFSVIVTYEPWAEDAARAVASELTDEVERRRDEFVVVRDDPATAVARALEARERPVVLADIADNIGGGSPGDGTALLAELLRQGASGAVVPIADAAVAREAAQAGVGSALDAEVGGKTDVLHGPPVGVAGRVVRITDGRYRGGGTWMTGHEFSMGTTAVIEVDGVTLVVMERAVPPFHAEQLLSVGIDPSDADYIVAKGAVAWRAAYGDIAGTVIEVDTPGICPLDPATLPRTTAPMRA
jgi:microcystin degradation protein MlrC